MRSEPAELFARRVEELFHRALELPDGEWKAFVAEECRGDEDLQCAVQELLAASSMAEIEPLWRNPAIHNEALHSARAAAKGDSALERYRLLERIGAGGMGVVYRAIRSDNAYSQEVAVKIVRAGAGDDGMVRRFRQERQILARLEHPNIARLLDGGSTPDGRPFLVMEYVEGTPLTRYLTESQRPKREILELFRTICAAVSFLHRNLVVHRDLKPANILVKSDGTPKLVDFGIAKLLGGAAETTVTAAGAMTPEYASPEQVRGGAITTASDVYSLGVLLCEMLTGERPYRKAASALEMAHAICEEAPRFPDGGLDSDLERIVRMALRKEPERRYSSADRFAEDIRRYLAGYPVTARQDTLAYRGLKFIRRNRIAVTAAGLVLASLSGGIIATVRQAQVSNRERAAAQRRFNEVRRLAHAVIFDYHDSIAALPGSTAILGQLVNDGLAYLDGIAADSGGDQAFQLELASAYLRVGDVQGRPYTANLGQTDGALASYRKGLAILEPIAAKDARNRNALRQMATACERIGNIQLRKLLFTESAVTHRKALAIREQLLAAEPDMRRDVAASYLYLGDALQGACRNPPEVECLTDALRMQQKAAVLREELARENPSDAQAHRELAQAYQRIGFRLRDIAASARGRSGLVSALEFQQKALEIKREVAKANPRNTRDRRDVADERMSLSEMQEATGNLPAAIAGYRESIATFLSISAADPSNAEARRDAAFAWFKQARLLARAGNTAEAMKSYAESLTTLRRLIADDPDSAEDLRTVSAVYSDESTLAAKAGDYRTANDLLRKAMAAPGGDYSLPWQWNHRAGEVNFEAAGNPRTPPSQRPEYLRLAQSSFQRSRNLLEEQARSAPLNADDGRVLEAIKKRIVECRERLARLPGA